MGKGSGKGKGKGEASVVAMAGWGHSNTVVTESTSGEKMGGAMCGVCVGPVLFIVALILVGWNEYHTVQVGKTIDAAESDSEDADCNTLSSDLNDQLVFMSCPITGMETLSVTAPFSSAPPGPPPPVNPNAWASSVALRLDTTVEYFAWKEHSTRKTVSCTGTHQPNSACKSAGSDITITQNTNQAEWTTDPQTIFTNTEPTLQQQWDMDENRQITQPCAKIDYRGYGSWC